MKEQCVSCVPHAVAAIWRHEMPSAGARTDGRGEAVDKDCGARVTEIRRHQLVSSRQRLIAMQATAIGATLTLSLSRARLIACAAQCFIRGLTLAGGLPSSARTDLDIGGSSFGAASVMIVPNDYAARVAAVRLLEASRSPTKQYPPSSANASRPRGMQYSHRGRDGKMRCAAVTLGCKLD